MAIETLFSEGSGFSTLFHRFALPVTILVLTLATEMHALAETSVLQYFA